jgi:formate hydrogenlyase transcriptional activator
VASEATLEAVQRRHILEALGETDWRIEGAAGAAARLGLKAGTLRSRMKKLGIQHPG